jgi:hypothetical protein
MVVQEDGRPADLCLGAVDLMLPPRCGTMPIPNWDWGTVQGEQAAGGVTWGNYALVGAYDGRSVTVRDVGPPQAPPADPDQIEIPCPEPAGGWEAPHPDRTSESDRQAALDLAAGQPDSSGVWVKILHAPRGVDEYGPNDVVLNAAFTGDVERHTRELVAVWGGPLCVARFERTEAELARIQDQLTVGGPAELGIQLLSSSVDVVHNRVELGIVVSDDALRSALDERFGKGVVRLLPELQPVD